MKMRKIIDFEKIKENKDFWLYFFVSNFPEAMDEESDYTLTEIIDESYVISEEWVNEFTQTYDEVFEINDGYVMEPSTLELTTCNNKILIEYHPGDTIYYIDDIEVGCTGPHYSIKNISWNDYLCYFKNLSDDIKLLFLPMVYITYDDINELCSLVKVGLQKAKILPEHYDLICSTIVENCLL